MPSSLTSVLKSIRELSFDRFVTPCFFITHTQGLATWTYQVTTDKHFIIFQDDVSKLDFDLNGKTLDELLQQLIVSGLPVRIIYSGSFVASEPADSILVTGDNKIALDLYRPVFRTNYFSDTYIEKYFDQYAQLMLNKKDAEIDNADWDSEFQDAGFDRYRELHFTLWVAYFLVGDRRLYEMAAQNMLMSSDGGNPLLNGATSTISGGSFSLTGPGEEIQVSVGDVFQLSESHQSSVGVYNNGEIPKDMIAPWGIGSDNTLMDYYSFWYRLQLWIRDQFEIKTGDYSLRKNNMITGKIHIDPRDSSNYFAYFDSYPWVFSPYLRGNSEVQDLRT